MIDTGTTNPLLQRWDTPYGLPPFDAVRAEHFAPAFEAAMREHRAEIDAIAGNAQAPSFDNTIAAFDAAGRLLARIDMLFSNLTASATSPQLQAVERDMAAPLAAHANAVYMHAALFARIDALHAARDRLGLDAEQRRLLERVHLDFVRAGACLPVDKRLRYGQVMERLAALMTQFAQNVLADENAYRLVLRSDDELAGLPPFVRAAARQAARERGVTGDDAHVITLSRSLILPFLTFSERRDLREQAWRAWTTRGEHDGPTDNRPLAREILALRNDQARAHGCTNYADYALGDSMALTQAAVMGLLERVWTPAMQRVEVELEELSTLARSLGERVDIEAWDWRYYAEKLRVQRYALDESQLKPYFPLERMIDALFDCARRLFGLEFVHRPEVGAYHPDVRVYEVRDVGAGGARPIGLFLHDNYARAGKRSGAWMSALRWQSRRGPHGDVLPLILNNNNFAKGSPGEPTLLSFDDARTLFHEFGHGLHGLLSKVGYERLSGVQVLRDFVELPSQLFEHWLVEPEVLKRHACHVHTGEPIPDALIAKIRAAERFNQGYETVRYAASALLDMAAHAQTSPDGVDITSFERDELERLSVPRAVGVNHRLAHFQHLFSTAGYAAGYYVYLWAEVLEADAFDAFRQAGDAFDPALAQRLRECIYSVGNSVEPGAAYRAFRGRAATVEPMLRERGLLAEVD